MVTMNSQRQMKVQTKPMYQGNHLFWLLPFFLIFFLPIHAFVRVQAEADQVDHFEELPIPVTIMITHRPSETIESQTFKLGQNPIQVDKVKDVGDPKGNEEILTIYHYDLPGKPKGLHVLPQISVKVGGSIYKSVASTFEVKGMGDSGNSANTTAPSAVSSNGSFLKLENIIQGPTTLYPGQTTIVGYRYSYNANIETINEVTPLFEPKGFLKVGDKIVNHKDTSDTSILEVTQQIEAKEPGTYTIGPSSIEGYVYTEDSLGKRSYNKNSLRSVAPAVTFTVKEVPNEKKPASYNGAIGKYTFKVNLQSPANVSIGDEMTLLVEISGNGDLETVQLPDLCCQPGMSGLFKLSDLPPVGKIEGDVKRFTVQLRPLSSVVKAIPVLEFSFFDPDTQKFQVLHSSEIPIKVTEVKAKEPKVPLKNEDESDKRAEPSDWRKANDEPAPIEVEGNYILTNKDLKNLWFSSWWMLLFIPVVVGLLWYQKKLKIYLDSKEEELPVSNSGQLYEEAWREQPHSPAFYEKLYQAFYVRLQERGDIDATVNSIEKLPATGAAGDVKAFFTALEQARYAADQGVKEGILLEQAKTLFNELEARP